MPTATLPSLTSQPAPASTDLVEIAQASDNASKKCTLAQLVEAVPHVFTAIQQFEVPVQIKPGTAGIYAKDGVLSRLFADVGNSGSSETDLHSHTVPANALGSNGDSYEFDFTLQTAGNANNKRVRVYYNSTTLFDSTSLALNAANVHIKVEITRTGANTQRCTTTISSDSSLLIAKAKYVASTEISVNTATVKVTGLGTASNDVISKMSKARWVSAV